MDALATRARFAPHLSKSVAATLVLLTCANTYAASHRTTNFIVTAKTKELAVAIAEAAERYRAELSVEWLGYELPRWQEPCPVKAKVAPHLGAGGATSFLFETYEHQYARPVGPKGDGLFQAKPAGRPFGWEMTIQGSRERVLDSVLPHEVTHTIFATHFGRPLPRWADEGACTTVEHASEKAKQHRYLYEFLKTNRGIAFNQMFAMNEYPADILPLYSQGFSLARYFIQQGGKQKFMKYIEDGLNSNNWTESTKQHYGFESLSELQVTWLDWVRNGSVDLPQRSDPLPTVPELETPSRPNPTYLASNSPRGPAMGGPAMGAAATGGQLRPGVRQQQPWGSQNSATRLGGVQPASYEEPTNSARESNVTWSKGAAPANNGPNNLAMAKASRANASQVAHTGSSWYVNRSRQAQGRQSIARRGNDRQATARGTVPSSRPKFDIAAEQNRAFQGTRVASRPNANKHQREVLLEWGQPAPFLAPQTASRSGQWR